MAYQLWKSGGELTFDFSKGPGRGGDSCRPENMAVAVNVAATGTGVVAMCLAGIGDFEGFRTRV
jgi:hypothetical protein